MLRNLGGLASGDLAVPVLAGAGLTGVSFALDDSARAALSGNDLAGLRSFGNRIGAAEVVGPLAGSLFLAGRLSSNRRFREMTYDLAQSQLVVLGVGHALKRVVNRERPNGSDYSLPSGHSFAWSAMATVVERHYGVRAALPAIGLWAITSAARIASDEHYLSDVVAGAALGYLVARTTVRVNDAALPGAASPQLHVAPMWDAGGRGVGLGLSLTF